MDYIARNIKSLREANSFTQQHVADFLGITRSAYGNYELNSREIPFKYLERLANLFGCDLDVLISEDEAVLKDMLVCAFRTDDIDTQDLQTISEFKKVVFNYLKISRLISNE
ncbi:MAG: helix-turn-helix transcriptional regulator [Bacteroidales bacterium]|nr:helix-turn-helix transcriptional regulator [Bacteroidales bacterium]